METIITGEQSFNEGYSSKFPYISLKNLFEYAVSINQISEENAQMVINSYKSVLYERIIANYEYDEYSDINQEIEEELKNAIYAIDDYLAVYSSPYDAIKYILDNNPKDVIDYSKKRYEEYKNELNIRAKQLQENSTTITMLHNEYKGFIEYLIKRIQYKIDYALYPLMNGVIKPEINSLSDLDSLIHKAELELSIVLHFSKDEIINMLKSFKFEDYTKNLAECFLYNYFFNSFYKDGASVNFTKNMDEIIKRDIRMGLFDADDVKDVIENGEIKFSEEEKEYILNYFLKTFISDIIESKVIDRPIVNRKK